MASFTSGVTRATGDIVTAAQWNTVDGAGGNGDYFRDSPLIQGYVGIGTGVTTATTRLQIKGTTASKTYEDERADSNAQVDGRGFRIAMDNVAYRGSIDAGLGISMSRTGPAGAVDNAAGDIWHFYASGRKQVGMDKLGNLILGFNTSNTTVSTAPSGLQNGLVLIGSTQAAENKTSGCSLFVVPVSAVHELRVRDENGNVTTLSPHNYSLFSPPADAEYPWSYYAENPILGKKINVDMFGAIRALEQLTNKKFIYTSDMAENEKESVDPATLTADWVKRKLKP